MNCESDPQASDVASFRAKLLVSMMLVVAAIAAAALYASNKDAAAGTERELRREFEREISARHFVQEIHHATLVERCRALVGKPRIHAALEDEAPDLLYPTTKDELPDLVEGPGEHPAGRVGRALHARFYRFLDANGAVIPAPDANDAGPLSPEEEARLCLKSLPETFQAGYLARTTPTGAFSVEEIIIMPIISQENGEVISAMVLGFKPDELDRSRGGSGIRSGFWLDQQLILPSVSESTAAAIGAEIARAVSTSGTEERSLDVRVDGVPHLLFFKQLNPGSSLPPAYEVIIYPLSALIEKQRLRMWQVLGAGTVLMLSGLAASHYISRRLSEPVEKLAESRKELQRTLDDLRATEQELIQSEKMASLGILTGGIMHELNNPLNFARSALFILGQKASRLPEHARGGLSEPLGDIKEGLSRISTIVSDLRIFCSPETILASSCPVLEPLQSSIRMLTGSLVPARIELHADVPGGITVRGDRNQLALVFVNLIKNSIDAHLGRQPPRPGQAHIWISARTRGHDVEISVKDDGPGIRKENLPKLFDPFFTTKPPGRGTGLGLSTVYRIISAHGGTITAQCRPESGAEFHIRLTRATRPNAESNRVEPALAV